MHTSKFPNIIIHPREYYPAALVKRVEKWNTALRDIRARRASYEQEAQELRRAVSEGTAPDAVTAFKRIEELKPLTAATYSEELTLLNTRDELKGAIHEADTSERRRASELYAARETELREKHAGLAERIVHDIVLADSELKALRVLRNVESVTGFDARQDPQNPDRTASRVTRELLQQAIASALR